MKNINVTATPKRLNPHSSLRKKERLVAGIEQRETQAYNWTIETAVGIFTGTCLSIKDLNQEINMLTNSNKILKKNIIPLIAKNNTKEDKIYTWYVTTNSSQVSGVSVSLEEAKKVIESFGYNDVISSHIVESSIPLQP